MAAVHSDSASTIDAIKEVQRERAEHEEVLKPTPSRFEKLYLAPEQAVAGKLRLTFGNPTPVAIAGFILANTPACIDLMGWGGAGGGVGNTSAGVGSFYYMGAVLLYLGAIGEWILGNTFPCVAFMTFGGYWGTFGATLTPFFDAIDGYADPTTNKADTAAFYDSFAFFLVFMSLLSFLYMIAALRTNVCLVSVLFFVTISLPTLTASYFYGANGSAALCKATRIAAGALGFVASMIAWYLFLSLILEAVDFPIVLPVGDLTKYIKGRSEKAKSAHEMA